MEVKELLSKVKPNKTTGCNLIPPLEVNQSADILCWLENCKIEAVILGALTDLLAMLSSSGYKSKI